MLVTLDNFLVLVDAADMTLAARRLVDARHRVQEPGVPGEVHDQTIASSVNA